MKSLLFCAAALASLCGAAGASTITGSVWENQSNSNDAIPANVPLTTPDVTFSTSAVDFSSGSAYSIGEFLNSANPATVFLGASELNNTVNNTIWDFQGTVSVTDGEQFTATHDDGLTLVIGGLTVVSAAGPTAPVNTTFTYTGPTGTFPFDLVYGECCGAPAVLRLSLPLVGGPVPGEVPLPAGLPLLLSGLSALGFMGWRKKRAAVA